jgi:3-methyladenine DNA glycosylase AlkD
MTPADLIKKIRAYCKAHGNPANVKKYQRFFKEGYDAYGLDVATYEAGIKSLTDAGVTLKTVLEAAPDLLKSGKYEETSFVLSLIKRSNEKYTSKTFKEIERFFDYGIVNWAHADMLAGDIVPQFILDKIVPLEALEPWQKGENKFQRRVSAVSLIKLMKQSGNVKPHINFVEPLMTDSAREVHQGVGWFLREAWVIDRDNTEKFLLKWKDTAPRLIFQYATEKMTPAERQRFRRSKS